MRRTARRKTIAAGTATQRSTAQPQARPSPESPSLLEFPSWLDSPSLLEIQSWLDSQSSSSAHRRRSSPSATTTAATLRGGLPVRLRGSSALPRKGSSAILRGVLTSGREVSCLSRQEKPRPPLPRRSQNSQKCSHALRSKSLSGDCAAGFVPHGAGLEHFLSLNTRLTLLSTHHSG
jgi:hypothetical protein